MILSWSGPFVGFVLYAVALAYAVGPPPWRRT